MLEAVADLKPRDFKIDNKPDIEDLFIDYDDLFLENDNLKEEYKKFILELINKTDFSFHGRAKHELRVASCQFRYTSYEFTFTT